MVNYALYINYMYIHCDNVLRFQHYHLSIILYIGEFGTHDICQKSVSNNSMNSFSRLLSMFGVLFSRYEPRHEKPRFLPMRKQS